MVRALLLVANLLFLISAAPADLPLASCVIENLENSVSSGDSGAANPARLPEGPKELHGAFDEVAKMPEKPDDFCKTSECTPAEMEQTEGWFKKRFAKTCLLHNPAAIESLAKSLALTWASYVAVQWTLKDLSLKDFPWEFVADGLIWNTVFAEIGCRNNLRTPGDSLTAKPKSVIQKMRPYLLWSAIGAGTGVVLSEIADRLRGQHPSAQSWVFRFGFFATYDTAFGPLKRVFVLDPLFLKAFPSMKQAINNLVKQKVIALALNETADWAGRYAIQWGDSQIFLTVNSKVKPYFNEKRTEPALGSNEAAESSMLQHMIREFDEQDAGVQPR